MLPQCCLLLLFTLHNTHGTETLFSPSAAAPIVPSVSAISPIHGGTAERLPGRDFLGPMWLPRTYKITCCRGGVPQAENTKLIRNWTQTAADYAFDERGSSGDDEECRVFTGGFELTASALFTSSGISGYGVTCKCPEKLGPLDKHCRRLPDCQNGGYRSYNLNMRCACPESYFGEFCEKTCDQGQKLKGVDGRDYCSCVPFYQGEECREMVCLNGGVEHEQRCTCPPTFLGYHCEIDSNRSAVVGGRMQRFGDQQSDLFTRDISGTVFSLIMIVVLVVSMYLLMKHRMQVQNRFTHSRREIEMARAAYGMGRRGDGIHPEMRQHPFVIAGIEGPPPYTQHGHRIRSRNEMLPPLPSYEDATKLPPLRHGQAEEATEPAREEREEREQTTPSTAHETPVHRPPTPSPEYTPSEDTAEETSEEVQVPLTEAPPTETPPTETPPGDTPVLTSEEHPSTHRSDANRRSI